MSDVPTACPACGTDVPPGRSRCVACGRVFGEDNRCPHCNAVAAVVPRGEGFACAACSGPRDCLPDTVVLPGMQGRIGSLLPLPSSAGAPAATQGGAAPAARPRPALAAANRGRSAGLRFLGAASIGLGILAAVAAVILVPGAAGVAFAVFAGGTGVGAGALSLRAGANAARRAEQQATTAMEQAILRLAETSDGDLTATEVARALGVGMVEADSALTAMADGSRVGVEVNPDGIIHYVFRELQQLAPSAPRVRVGAGEQPAAEAVEEAVEAVGDRADEESSRGA